VYASDSDLVAASFAVVLPDEPLPVRLMNTIWADRLGVHDVLITAPNLRAWLAAVRPDDALSPPDDQDLERFRSFRDGLRRLAALLTDDTRPAAASPVTDIDQAVSAINTAVAYAPTRPQLAYRDGQILRAASGHATAAQRALSAMAEESIDLFTGEGQARLRACHAPGCVLYFVKDHPRREWCSTTCGNRARVARHYQRHHRGQSDT
jgi:predicted RNA-binding Zn ribbon-like protein